MPDYNFMVTVGDAMQAELFAYVKDGTPAVTFPDINNISQATVDVLNNIYDSGALERMFKSWSAAGRIYKMWSCYSDKPADAPQVRADFDMLTASYPQDFSISGAWRYSDGAEVGAGGAGVWYPIPNPQYLNFMPDVIVDNTDPENPVYGPATEPADINLLFGQAPRVFDSFYGP